MKFQRATIISNQKIPGKDEFYQLLLAATEISAQAQSGQFIMISAGSNEYPFLKRPMAISHIKQEKGHIGIIYQIRGKGTALMSRLAIGSGIDILGPLGNGWQIPPQLNKVCLVGGGSGIGPLLPLAQSLKSRGIPVIDIMIGGCSAQAIVCEEEFRQSGKLLLATEDGSLGQRGMVSIYFSEQADYDAIYSCGPLPMMKAAADWAAQRQIPCQVSLEERMGCGWGVCMGCVCASKQPDGTITHQRICHEGPVFPAGEVFFND